VKKGEDAELRFRTGDDSGADLGRLHGACLFSSLPSACVRELGAAANVGRPARDRRLV
jgi:hypothetical protein